MQTDGTRQGIAGRPSAGWVEPLLILAIVAVGPSFYIAGLGFYTDDWPFLRDLAQSKDQSIGGLYAALAGPANVAVRPLQILLFIFYHKIAPGSAIFPHIFNQVMFAGAALGFYGGLRRLPRMRGDAYHLVLIYVCLPHYVTQRLWYANHQSTLSLLLFAVAFQIIVAIRLQRRVKPWLVAALFVVAAMGMLAYELFTFLLVAAPLFVASAARLRPRDLTGDAAFLSTTAVLLAALAMTTAFKMHVGHGLFAPQSAGDFLTNALMLYGKAAYTDVWTLGVAAPRAAWQIAHGPFYQRGAIHAAAIALVLIVAGEVLRRRRVRDQPADKVKPSFLALVGVAAFIVGYAPFLMNFFYDNSPFGIDNRGNIGGAFGLAFMVLAAARWVGAYGLAIGNALVIGCCVTGTFLQTSVGLMWDQAWIVQQTAYGRLRQSLPPLRAEDIVMLYGVCPYAGPTPVFSASWGLADRLQMDTGIHSIQANTITPTSEARPDGLMVIDDGTPTMMDYRTMVIFNAATNRSYRIGNYHNAQAFFARFPIRLSAGCDYDDYGGVSVTSGLNRLRG